MKWTKFLSVFLVFVTLFPLVATCVSASGYAIKVTIYYKNESGATIAPSVSTTINAAATNKPTWTSPTISGYRLKNSSDAVVTYSMLEIGYPPSHYNREGSGTYTVYYVREVTKTVNYVYNHNNSTAAPSKTQTGKLGETYSITSPAITGYTPTETVVSGTFTAQTYPSIVRYLEKSYTITFNANGGNGAPASVKKYHFTTLILPTATPTRYGYSFLGWSSSSTATSAAYSPGSSFILNRDITLYAVWSANTYSVTYNANGGSGAPSTQYKQFNVPLTLSTKVPTRSGYVFSGWARSATGSVAFQPGDSYTSNSRVDLYAVWTVAAKQYTVSYNANGGSGAPASQTKTEGVSLTLSSTKPTRSGYTFLGWGTSSSSTVASYSAGGVYTNDASITLYAVWSKIPSTYTVSYNANGGSGAPSSQTKTENVTLKLSITKPTRSGYTFLGWGTSSSATSAAYSAGGNYTANASITLYAVWSKNVSYYTVSYNANGGSGAPSSQTKTEGVSLTLSSTKPTRSGYTFLGWATSSGATSPSYYPGGSYTSNASITLYAVWSKVLSTYTVSYNANGGSGAPSAQTKTEGVALTLSSTTPFRSGYSFLGWGTSASSTSPSYSAGGTYTANASITLYAVWSKNTSYYTVSYSSNGGSGAPMSQTKTEDVPLTLSNTKPTRSGYTFLGWGTSSSATSPSYYPGGTYTANASITLYAVWSKVLSTYTVSYNANGGSGAPSAQTKTEGVALTLSSTVPFRSGYSFLGWGTSSSASSPSYSAGDRYTTDASITLYAVWSKNASYYTVSYSSNGGSGAPLSQTKTENVPLTLSSQQPTRSGYTFLGWGRSSGASSPAYYPGGTYTANASITLYAIWQKNVSYYTVSYNANGGTGAPSSQTKTEGVALTLSSTTPYRSGYSFLGWGTSSSASYPSYSAGDRYTTDASITLYAVWSKNASYYTVSYSSNGGSGAPLAQTKTENVPLTLSSTKPTRSGYTFLGWNPSSSATSPSYYPGGTYTANASITLYAVWQKNVSYYTVSYNANGGSGAPSAQTKTEGVALTLSSTVPFRSGYSFLGWGTSASSSTPSYSAGDRYTTDASITLYAVWGRNVNYYTVSYSANGGSGAPLAQTKTEGIALTLSSVEPTRVGYTFTGWSTSNSATTPSYYPGGTYTANASVTLYAVWYRNVSYYAVNYYANGGSGEPETQIKIEDVPLTLSSVTPYRSGYIFAGWSTSSSSSVVSYYPGSTFSGNYSLDLYAVWQRVLSTYTVSYNANGGSGAPDSQTKIEDTPLVLSSTAPVRSGYTFIGWSTGAGITSVSYYPGSTYTANSSMTLYAVWSRITYTVSYNANGGSGEPSPQIKYTEYTRKEFYEGLLNQCISLDKNGEQVGEHTISDHVLKAIREYAADAESEIRYADPVNIPTMKEAPKPIAKRAGVKFHPEVDDEDRLDHKIDAKDLPLRVPSDKYSRNIRAIRLIHTLEEENRLATESEQKILADYSGWGGLANSFDEGNSNYEELKSLLIDEEYKAARESTLTAFYTPPVVIQAIYKALGNMGFTRGNILEPSCGVGNFMGLLPESMRESRIYGVELDSLSGRIAQQLYQKQNITIGGFEETVFPDSFFDVAVGNVPFGQFKVGDKKYDKFNFLIHDYFFAKALDKVRPGGVVAFITSKGTMDKENPAVRKYIAQRAELIGAIRLPDNAFKSAGTDVVSDIIFLQKRDRVIETEPDWVHLGRDENGIAMNQYFVDNPDMILGDMVMRSGPYGPEPTCRAYDGHDLGELLSEAISNIHAEISEGDIAELEEDTNSIPADPNVKNYSYTIVDGNVYFRQDSVMNKVETSVTGENRIKGMIGIRDTVRALIDAQLEDLPDSVITALQEKLNSQYDAFTKKYGLINSRGKQGLSQGN